SGAGISQVTRIDAGSAFNPQVSGTGVVVFVSDTDLTGDNPNNEIQIFSINVNGSNLTQVTSQRLVPNNIALSDNGQRIAFEGIGDPFGTNADGSWEIFVIDIDGSNLAQISMSDGSSYAPKISDDGSLVVFTSREDLTGGNVDGNYEVFVARSDGTGIVQISDGDRDSGTFESGGPGDFDIAGNGSFVAFGSVANLTGENPDTEHTLFWAPAGGGPFAQFLREGTIAAGSLGRRANQVSMTNDGGGIAFESTQNYTSTAQPGNDKIYTTIRQ
ncbi:MAG: hypothetical protein OEN22_08150, partial [Gammaproteobacteria bacterium]|nr:hypothetical protein [Gammaproteobacteria bacterium]